MAVVTGNAKSAGIKPDARALIATYLKQYFGSTLAKEVDVENIIMSLCQLESSFNPSAKHQIVAEAKSSTARKVMASSAIATVRATGTPAQKANLNGALRAWGLMGCMGWNLIKGADPSGKTEIERGRPDIAPLLMVAAGEDLAAKFDGVGNLANQILAGMVMLENKYKYMKGSGTSWTIGNRTFSNRLTGALSAYLGLGAADVVTGITPEAYARSIMYGTAYKTANDASAPAGTYTVSNGTVQQTKATGPAITVASGQNRHPTGC